MIIGHNKDKVIENIKNNVENGSFNSKVEVDDPNLTPLEKRRLIDLFLNKYKHPYYFILNQKARVLVNVVTFSRRKKVSIDGIEKIKKIKGGAIITSNHFNPLDTLNIRVMAWKARRKRMHIVSQESNLAMKGLIGFLMRYADIIPISSDKAYLKDTFPGLLERALKKKRWILIYPEQEMWFNYKKPRPGKRGAYFYAAKFNVPIISCFVEMIDLDENDNEEFKKLKYIVHVLDPIYPDTDESVRDNSIRMMEQDYKQKKQAYEDAYGKELSYEFSQDDIAGWIQKEDAI